VLNILSKELTEQDVRKIVLDVISLDLDAESRTILLKESLKKSLDVLFNEITNTHSCLENLKDTDIAQIKADIKKIKEKLNI